MTGYRLEFYLVGATQPAMSLSLGKPFAGPDGKIRVDFAPLLTTPPTPGVVYEARVVAVGPGGSGSSDLSNDFEFSAPPCAYSVAPASRSLGSASGTSSFTVTAAAGCAWTATTPTSWIRITGGASGAGNGTVTFSVAANSGTSQRSGTLTIAGQQVTVTQSGSASCTYSVTPSSRSIAAGGGSSTFGVTAPAGCTWNAMSQAGWVTVTSGSSGSGNGTVGFTAGANSGAPRTGTLAIAGVSVIVSQSAAATPCTYTVSPTTPSIGSTGGTVTINVSTTSSCSWTATENVNWVSITSGASGSGNGAVRLQVTARTGSPRSMTMTIAGRTVTLTQNGTTTLGRPARLRIVR